MIRTVLAVAFFTMIAIGSCVVLSRRTAVVTAPTPFDDEIVVCGQFIHTGAPVVRWSDLRGYDGYLEHGFRDSENVLPTHPAPGCDTPRRYGVRQFLTGGDVGAPADCNRRTRRLLRERVDLIVMHYDAAGTSRRCFEVLHNERGLSAHFLVDVDGTIYQTLDVRERARHAGSANDRSVGIEIANVGAYEDLRELYAKAQKLNNGYGVRRSTAVKDLEPTAGYVQARQVYQFPFTDAQYDSLTKLTRALHTALPGIRLALPRTPTGDVPDSVLTPEHLSDFSGILGHHHVSSHKIDPGPAFDWERFFQGVVSGR